MLKNYNLYGVVLTLLIYCLTILVFVFRKLDYTKLEHYTGIVEVMLLIPWIIYFIKGIPLGRPMIFYVQVGLIIVWLLLEILVDYVMKINFRQSKKLLILYITLFYAGTGGLLGVVSYSGRIPLWISSILFLLMVLLSLFFH